MTDEQPTSGERSAAAQVLRWAVPVLLVAAGLLALVVGGETAVGIGIVLVGIAAIIAVWNLLLTLSFSSERDRDREESARRFLSRHGRWPGERSR